VKAIRALAFWFAIAIGAVALSGLYAWLNEGINAPISSRSA
jgi:acid phosphatase class B